MSAEASATPPQISVVVPVFNEEGNVEPLCHRLLSVLTAAQRPFEVIFVDDGSRDRTVARIEAVRAVHPEVRVLRLARNFGHQSALFAGMEHARGNAVITMDGDLQHPPELIPSLLKRWQRGDEVVQAIRQTTADVGPAKRLSSRGFYRVLSWVAGVRVTPGAADFRLLARPALDAFLACRERCRFNRGLVQWIGFACSEVPFDAGRRESGRTKYSYRAMFRLAGDAIFSFSSWPLRLAGIAGAAVSCAAAGYLLFVLWARIFTDRVEPGWSSILAAVLVLGGVQLIVLWILGEYIGRLYEEAKQRPIYIVREPRVRWSEAPPGRSTPATAAELRNRSAPEEPRSSAGQVSASSGRTGSVDLHEQ